MGKLFDNAVQSIQLGLEDYQANDERRSISAVRNFYAGVLLLAKEVLARTVPDADPEELLAENFKPVPNGQGGIKYEAASQRTIDFTSIGSRFRDFGLAIDQSALGDLNRIRKDVEHYFTGQPKEAIREAIAKAFPVVADLFRQAGEEPHRSLGDTWTVMLDVKAVYDRELAACRASFSHVDWQSEALQAAPYNCPKCHSDLVAQADAANTDRQSIECECRACGNEISAEDGMVRALETYFKSENYEALTESSELATNNCPECGTEAYIFVEGENRCAWCAFELDDECSMCSCRLTPSDVAWDDSTLCSYCNYKLSKND